jgi:hypothetical protein
MHNVSKLHPKEQFKLSLWYSIRKTSILVLWGLAFIHNQTTMAQNLDRYHWQNRLVLVIAEKNNAEAEAFLKAARREKLGLQDRKLKILRIEPDRYRAFDQADWVQGSVLYERFAGRNGGHAFVLVGLDGGVKARWAETPRMEEIFKLIDQMPMRRAEIKRRNK